MKVVVDGLSLLTRNILLKTFEGIPIHCGEIVSNRNKCNRAVHLASLCVGAYLMQILTPRNISVLLRARPFGHGIRLDFLTLNAKYCGVVWPVTEAPKEAVNEMSATANPSNMTNYPLSSSERNTMLRQTAGLITNKEPTPSPHYEAGNKSHY